MYSDDPSPSFRVLRRPHQGPDSGADDLLRLAVEISLQFGSGGQLRANDAVTSALALSWCADPVTGRPQPGFSWEALMVFIRGLPALQSCPFYPHTAPTSELLHEAVHSIHMDPGPQETHRWEPW